MSHPVDGSKVVGDPREIIAGKILFVTLSFQNYVE